jgi:dihydroorotase
LEIVLNSPLDMHLHLRDQEMLNIVAPLTSHSFAGALIMPNLIPPVTTKDDLISYKERILQATKNDTFKPYMTLFFRDSYDYDFIKSFGDELTAIKLYPAGITTNSEGGVSGFDIKKLAPTLEAMSELNLPLCIHGETNGFVMDREAQFVPIYEKLATVFPKLKIIMEHITTKESVEALEKHENLYATITLHHLLITLDDVAGGMLKPHLFCKPIAKRPHDRDALQNIVLKAHPKVMFGSDSAPHPQHAKESCGCAAGVFTAPIALAKLAEIFMAKSNENNLQKFISDNARVIYGITPPDKKVILEDKEMTVEQKYGDVVPMYAGEKIHWRIKGIK